MVTTREVTITSREAAEMLEKHKGPNRRTSEGRVLMYQADMEAGRWKFDGAPIRLSNEGKLLDGKHRLTALANTVPEMEIPFIVVEGLDPDAQLTMDQGGGRTSGQQLGLKGIGNAQKIAASVKAYLDWTRDRLFRTASKGGVTTKPETVEWALAHPELVEKLFQTAFLKIDAPSSVTGAFALAVMQFAPARGQRFLKQLAEGIDLKEGDPILALDHRLRSIRRNNIRVSQKEYLAYFIRTWNAWVSGNTLTKIQVGKLTEETFPQLLQVSDYAEDDGVSYETPA